MLKLIRDHAMNHTATYTWLTIFIGIAAEVGVFVGQVRFG